MLVATRAVSLRVAHDRIRHTREGRDPEQGAAFLPPRRRYHHRVIVFTREYERVACNGRLDRNIFDMLLLRNNRVYQFADIKTQESFRALIEVLELM